MAILRIFIAGHVIGVAEPERTKERAKIADVADLFESIGWDVISPADLMDDQSDPKDVLCKYIRMMMDCGFFYEFSNYLEYQECHTATMISNVYGIKPCRADFALLDKVQNLVDAIKDVTGVPFSEYSFVDRKKGANSRVIQQARTIFVHKCLSMNINPMDIAVMLKRNTRTKHRWILLSPGTMIIIAGIMAKSMMSNPQ